MASQVDKLDKLLEFDPVDTASKLSGGEEEVMLHAALALASMHGKELQDELMTRDDSYMNMSFAEFCKIPVRLGFELVLDETLEYVPSQYGSYAQADEDSLDECVRTYYHTEYGVLLFVESHTSLYSTKDGIPVRAISVNSAGMYYAWKPRQHEDVYYGDATQSGCFWSPNGMRSDDPMGTWIWHGHHDVREGFAHSFNKLLNLGTFVNEWKEDPSLWLIPYYEQRRVAREGSNNGVQDDRPLFDKFRRDRIEKYPEPLRGKLLLVIKR